MGLFDISLKSGALEFNIIFGLCFFFQIADCRGTKCWDGWPDWEARLCNRFVEKDNSMQMTNRGRSDYHNDDSGSGAAPRSRDGLV